MILHKKINNIKKLLKQKLYILIEKNTCIVVIYLHEVQNIFLAITNVSIVNEISMKSTYINNLNSQCQLDISS